LGGEWDGAGWAEGERVRGATRRDLSMREKEGCEGRKTEGLKKLIKKKTHFP
jgi:hypothetical protein